MPTYTYVNGPCSGRRRTTTQPLADGQEVTCGGATYQFNRDNPGALIWLDVGNIGVGPSPGPLAPHAHRGWHDVQRAINVTTAGETFRAGHIRRAALRRLGRRLRRG